MSARGEGSDDRTDLLVIGGGPGGYAAAFRAADLGLEVTLATDESELGGVCLLRGCIPSKTLLSLAELVLRAREAADSGIRFGEPEIDLAAVRDRRDEVVGRLTSGLAGLAKRRGVRVVQGRARLVSADRARVTREDDEISLGFSHAVLATGSVPRALPGVGFGRGVMDSAAALELDGVPDRLLVVGGGYVGLEMGTVYAAFGSDVTVVEMADRLLPRADADLVEPLAKRLQGLFHEILLETEVSDLDGDEEGVRVRIGDEEQPRRFDRALVAVGRQPRSDDLGLENTSVELDEDGFVRVDEQRRTAEETIFAIGDLAGGSMLAHEAMREGRVAAEVAAGRPAAYDVRAVPAVVYTDPELAWCGLTERRAAAEERDVKVVRFPWRASGRAVSVRAADGMTKLVLDPDSDRVLGVGIVGRDAEALIAEGVLAVEMGAVARDLALSVHPHPTLSETLGEAAELFLGGSPHLARGGSDA